LCPFHLCPSQGPTAQTLTGLTREACTALAANRSTPPPLATRPGRPKSCLRNGKGANADGTVERSGWSKVGSMDPMCIGASLQALATNDGWLDITLHQYTNGRCL
jgi:hypothetical protein